MIMCAAGDRPDPKKMDAVAANLSESEQPVPGRGQSPVSSSRRCRQARYCSTVASTGGQGCRGLVNICSIRCTDISPYFWGGKKEKKIFFRNKEKGGRDGAYGTGILWGCRNTVEWLVPVKKIRLGEESSESKEKLSNTLER